MTRCLPFKLTVDTTSYSEVGSRNSPLPATPSSVLKASPSNSTSSQVHLLAFQTQQHWTVTAKPPRQTALDMNGFLTARRQTKSQTTVQKLKEFIVLHPPPPIDAYKGQQLQDDTSSSNQFPASPLLPHVLPDRSASLSEYETPHNHGNTFGHDTSRGRAASAGRYSGRRSSSISSQPPAKEQGPLNLSIPRLSCASASSKHRGSRVSPRMRLASFTDSYKDAAETGYRSVLIHLGIKLNELNTTAGFGLHRTITECDTESESDRGSELLPDVLRARACVQILDELCCVPTPFQSTLIQLREMLLACVFENFHEDPSNYNTDASSVRMTEVVYDTLIPYFVRVGASVHDMSEQKSLRESFQLRTAELEQENASLRFLLAEETRRYESMRALVSDYNEQTFKNLKQIRNHHLTNENARLRKAFEKVCEEVNDLNLECAELREGRIIHDTQMNELKADCQKSKEELAKAVEDLGLLKIKMDRDMVSKSEVQWLQSDLDKFKQRYAEERKLRLTTRFGLHWLWKVRAKLHGGAAPQREVNLSKVRADWATCMRIAKLLPEFNAYGRESTSELLSDLCQKVSATIDDLNETHAKNEELSRTLDYVKSLIPVWNRDELPPELVDDDDIPKTKDADGNTVINGQFVGLGNGTEVPSYLRVQGLVRTRVISKREVEETIKEFWREKTAADQYQLTKARTGVRARHEVNEFFYQFLKKRFGVQSALSEFAYNFIDGLERYRWDPDCEMFLLIIKHELHEDVLHDQEAMLEAFKALMIKLDLGDEGKKTNLIKKAVFVKALRLFFPIKRDEDYNALKQAVYNDQPVDSPAGSYDYQEFFLETRDGNQTEFIELMRMQHVLEIQKFIHDLQANLTTKQTGPSGLISAEAIKATFREMDPEISKRQLSVYLARGFGIKIDDLSDTSTIAEIPDSKDVRVEDFMSRIKTHGIIKRSSNWNPNVTVKDVIATLTTAKHKRAGMVKFLQTFPAAVEGRDSEAGSMLSESSLLDRSSIMSGGSDRPGTPQSVASSFRNRSGSTISIATTERSGSPLRPSRAQASNLKNAGGFW
eukprot:GILK01006927.1.p1 GENE.GILK01006927.1~~GILK01006927.1.p1  ORF type:complete len:1058 (+),score=172.30 GILK01006927.1:141-3314(+)